MGLPIKAHDGEREPAANGDFEVDLDQCAPAGWVLRLHAYSMPIGTGGRITDWRLREPDEAASRAHRTGRHER